MAGVTMLGEGKSAREIQDKARKEGIEVVVVFDIEVVQSRGILQNTTALEVYDSRKGDIICKSGNLLNTRVESERESGKGTDSVDAEINKLFTAIDSKLQMGEFPSGISADAVEKQVAKLSEQKFANPLPVIAEFAYYHKRKLISSEILAESANKVVGKELATKFASVNQDQVIAAFSAWLPKDRPKSK